MPKDYFSISHSSSLDTLKKGDHIHVIGVCGVAMAQLAVLLSESGFSVSGSDKEFYEPMGSLLRASSVSLFEGYREENIPSSTKLVVIGNAISYGNSEVSRVENEGLPYTFFPKLLSEVVIGSRHSIVVTGTHGKSTTTALTATVLEECGAQPSYFIGAQVLGLSTSLKRGEGNVSVCEGDEYDSAFFAKLPKFHFYKPTTLIITSIEFDHADIYADLEAIKREFRLLVKSLPEGGRVICCIDDATVREEVEEFRSSSKAEIMTYGTSEDAMYRVVKRREEGDVQHVELGDGTILTLPLAGEFSARNSVAVYLATTSLGIESASVVKAIGKFKGLKRRQEVLFDNGSVTLIEDFAHHPTAVRETLRGLGERFHGRRLWAVFEPRSNTSRRRVFQNDYIAAFSSASEVVLCEVVARHNDQGVELLSVSELADSINSTKVRARSLPDAGAIAELLMSEVKKGDVIVIMSNGSFGGLPSILKERLEGGVIAKAV